MTKIIVFHESHGCQAGCCGHAVRMDGAEGGGTRQFRFTHRDDEYETEREFAERLLRVTFGVEHVKDLDNCIIETYDGCTF